MKLAKKIAVVVDGLNRVLFGFTGVLVMYIMVAISADTMMRYFMNKPIEGTLEFTEHSLFLITFLALAWLMKTGGHVTIDVVVNRLVPKNRALLGVITSVLAAIIALIFLWVGTEITWSNFIKGIRFGGQGIGMLPKAPVLAAIPISFLLLFIESLRKGWGYLRDWSTQQSQGQR